MFLHHGETFETLVHGQRVRFDVRARANRRYITLAALRGGALEVRIPACTPVTLSEVQSFIAKQEDWIAEQLEASRRRILAKPPVILFNGETFEEVIDGQTIRFTVKRQANRRRIGLSSVGEGAFEVRIPALALVTLSEVQAFIAGQTAWIAERIKASQQRIPEKPAVILRHDESFEEVIDGQRVRFTVKAHPNRRRTGLVSVGGGAFEVRVPARTRLTLAEAQKFISEQKKWIAEQVDAYQRRTPEKTARLSDGGSVQLFGVWTTVELGAARSALLHPGKEGSRLQLAVSPKAAATRIVTAFSLAATLELIRFIRDTLEGLRQICPASVGKVKVAVTRSRWGSCDAKGNMTFTFWLVCLPPWAVRLVVAHEYAHRFEMNHGPRFHETLERFVPEHRALQKRMNEQYKIRELTKLLGLNAESSG